MVAYLLLAGFGTRMRPLTEDTPKSLLQVGGRPLIDDLLRELQEFGRLDAVHLAVNHRDAPAFQRWADDWRAPLAAADTTLHIHDDGVTSVDDQLGALGDLQFLLDQTDRPSTGAVVAGGDSLFRFPLSPILHAFSGRENHVLALYEPNRQRRRHSSTLELEGTTVTGLVETPEATTSERICPSWYLLTPPALGAVEPYLQSGGERDSLGPFIDHLAAAQTVRAIRLPDHHALRLHCNTPEDLDAARTIIADEGRYAIDEAAVRACLPESRT